MKKNDEKILEQSEVDQFTYKNMMQAGGLKSVLFRHDDQSVNKVLQFNTGGYEALSVLPYTPQAAKPSGRDRFAMFQNREKPPDEATANRPDWTNSSSQKKKQMSITKVAGWKFHLSIAQDAANVEKAWNSLVPILLKYKVGETKVVRPESQQDASKVITVYTFSGGPELNQWESFLEDTELAFRQNEVVPGEQIFESHIEGSAYIYYRNDADENGEYVKDEYNFIYKVVDQIPLSESQLSELAFELNKQGQNKVTGCIVKLKGSDTCILHLKVGNDWATEKFDVNLLKNIENSDSNQQITISPTANRDAYVKLVVPKLDGIISSTNNVTKSEDPFKDIDLTHTVQQAISQSTRPMK